MASKVLDDAGIRYVDALPALRKGMGEDLYYKGPADMHPSAKGYRAIGMAAASLFRESSSAPSLSAGRPEEQTQK